MHSINCFKATIYRTGSEHVNRYFELSYIILNVFFYKIDHYPIFMLYIKVELFTRDAVWCVSFREIYLYYWWISKNNNTDYIAKGLKMNKSSLIVKTPSVSLYCCLMIGCSWCRFVLSIEGTTMQRDIDK